MIGALAWWEWRRAKIYAHHCVNGSMGIACGELLEDAKRWHFKHTQLFSIIVSWFSSAVTSNANLFGLACFCTAYSAESLNVWHFPLYLLWTINYAVVIIVVCSTRIISEQALSTRLMFLSLTNMVQLISNIKVVNGLYFKLLGC